MLTQHVDVHFQLLKHTRQNIDDNDDDDEDDEIQSNVNEFLNEMTEIEENVCFSVKHLIEKRFFGLKSMRLIFDSRLFLSQCVQDFSKPVKKFLVPHTFKLPTRIFQCQLKYQLSSKDLHTFHFIIQNLSNELVSPKRVNLKLRSGSLFQFSLLLLVWHSIDFVLQKLFSMICIHAVHTKRYKKALRLLHVS